MSGGQRKESTQHSTVQVEADWLICLFFYVRYKGLVFTHEKYESRIGNPRCALCHVDHLEQKAIKTQQMQENILPFPKLPRRTQMGAWPKMRAVNRGNFSWAYLHGRADT